MGQHLNTCMQVNEYNVIGSAVRLDEIPPEYRRLKLLGRGATSLAFEKDATTVLMFTRDQIKLEWLRDGIRISHNYQPVNPVRWNHIRGMSRVPMYMIHMPKLFPLDSKNRRTVTQELKQFNTVTNQVMRTTREPKWLNRIAEVVDAYHAQYPNSIMLPLLEWLMNYDPDQFHMDLGIRQFKQTAHGDIVLLDPVVSSELMSLFTQQRAR